MTLTYTNTLDDLTALNRFVLETGGIRRGALPLRGFAALLVLGLSTAISGGALYFLPIGLLAAALTYIGSPRAFARVMAEQSAELPIAKSFLCQHTVTLSSAGLAEVTEYSNNFTSWVAMDRIVETPTHVFLFLAPAIAHIVPRSQVPAQDLDAFVQEARGHLKAPAAAV
jgi:hypothetical protein